ncbi:hypothetical protein NB693_23060 [Pantoea ananatis]|uniref:hypothetical protein n=1 Tax=Pantoea ananas TaxID=553 RepID=UPI002220D35F|nr:hypothetical protein [Pantoea ananatis]
MRSSRPRHDLSNRIRRARQQAGHADAVPLNNPETGLPTRAHVLQLLDTTLRARRPGRLALLAHLPLGYLRLSARFAGAHTDPALRDQLRATIDLAHRAGLLIIGQQIEQAQAAAAMWSAAGQAGRRGRGAGQGRVPGDDEP